MLSTQYVSSLGGDHTTTMLAHGIRWGRGRSGWAARRGCLRFSSALGGGGEGASGGVRGVQTSVLGADERAYLDARAQGLADAGILGDHVVETSLASGQLCCSGLDGSRGQAFQR